MRKFALLQLQKCDVGLLSWQYGSELRSKILLEDKMANLGGMYENFVAQELHTHGFPLFFYLQPRQMELDALITWQGRVWPIEVKSGKEYKIHASLDKTLQNPQNELDGAIVFSANNMQRDGKIIYCPIYLCGWLKKETELPRMDIPAVPV